MEFITKSPEETRSLGKKVGASLKGGETLALVGELGSGKTAFVQGLAEGLGITSKIPSPTFILMRTYQAEALNLYHLDLYRLEHGVEKEVKNLGVDDLWGKSGAVVVVEWADRLTTLWPDNTVWISFEQSGDQERKITIND